MNEWFVGDQSRPGGQDCSSLSSTSGNSSLDAVKQFICWREKVCVCV